MPKHSAMQLCSGQVGISFESFGTRDLKCNISKNNTSSAVVITNSLKFLTTSIVVVIIIVIVVV
jgi:hypothetical protein